MVCKYCGTQVSEERWALGYTNCLKPDCVANGLQDRRANYRLILMPKQGFAYVDADSPDLMNGKSSGR